MVGGGISTPLGNGNGEMLERVSDPVPDILSGEEPPPEPEPDGKRITISVYLGQPHCFDR